MTIIYFHILLARKRFSDDEKWMRNEGEYDHHIHNKNEPRKYEIKKIRAACYLCS